MSLAEGVQTSIRFKKYAAGTISSNSQPVSSSDPGASGGQLLRRVSSSLKLAKDTYQSNEVRSDRQIADYRHGTKRVTGSISGELSPATYFDFLEAALRCDRSAAAIALDEADLTSLAADNATSKFTAAAGDPVDLGLRVGDYITPTNTTANAGKRFMITGFGGTSNREISVTPAPADATADTDFDLTTVGRSIFAPSALSDFVSRKFLFEHYHSDIDLTRLFTECRIGGFTLQMPANGMSTIEIPVMGRDEEILSAGSAPFFGSPSAETTTGIAAAVNGLMRVGGATVGVVTGINVQLNLNPQSDAVVGQNFVPEIFLGRANVTGQITAFLEDGTLLNDFKNESEISVLMNVLADSSDAPQAMSLYLPRIKFTDADAQTTGEAGQSITLPFQALKGDGSTAGDEATTIRIVDTEISA